MSTLTNLVRSLSDFFLKLFCCCLYWKRVGQLVEWCTRVVDNEPRHGDMKIDIVVQERYTLALVPNARYHLSFRTNKSNIKYVFCLLL